MTPEAKSRRNLRHLAQKTVKKDFLRRMGFRSTTGTINAAVKQFVDGQLSQMRKKPLEVRPLDNA